MKPLHFALLLVAVIVAAGATVAVAAWFEQGAALPLLALAAAALALALRRLTR